MQRQFPGERVRRAAVLFPFHVLARAVRIRASSKRTATTVLLLGGVWVGMGGGVSAAWGQSLPPGAVDPDAQRQLQQQREAQQRQSLEREPDVRLRASPPPARQPLRDDERPCFQIDHIELDGVEGLPALARLRAALDGPQGDDAPLGRCLGAQSIGTLVTRLQDAVIEAGYITTRVLAKPQDLSTGRLVLTVVPGRVHRIRLREGTSPQVRLLNALPIREGDVLNLRDMEQALENLQRVPGAQADIQVEPARESAAPGYSDLAVSYQGGRQWRMQLSLDDSGSDATGRYPLALTASLDHALTLNDLFYLTLNRDTGDVSRRLKDRDGPQPGTGGNVLHYSLPWGHSLISMTFSRSGYRQVVIGANQNYVYRGTSNNGEVKLSHMLWRDGQYKLNGWVKLFGRGSRNYIDDTEVEVQRRRVGGWESGINLKRNAGGVQTEGELSWKRGTGAFHSLRAPEEDFGEGSSRMSLLQGEVSVAGAVPLGERKLQLSTQWKSQYALRPLTPQDRFSIGGRYTVRGFGSDTSLSAENGMLLRNEAELPLTGNVSLYTGLDAGVVSGQSAKRLAGKRLVGAVLGTRVRAPGVYLDVFAGTPVQQPSQFPAARVVAGFNLSLSR
ncbi:ShlB/FhaC/HecB family hemolysin secretion/activation protein [Roseateles amylovorans]|uniref:ShlB/FhaC/HecB family hemolysin secretion/activation protein n=1 Tax=Roseateles amylovorans TaxID=2978473 RepID=A0ABY6AYA6_9BURK|nr:ShlB/FhaC/HecB family hemolysin secretion/activation protein [Roseateles amylovorans]UXH77379.1 ShlB/FhaC/HecB family hemolysin secretion/activation protein [Roseateles amylovorans]